MQNINTSDHLPLRLFAEQPVKLEIGENEKPFLGLDERKIVDLRVGAVDLRRWQVIAASSTRIDSSHLPQFCRLRTPLRTGAAL